MVFGQFFVGDDNGGMGKKVHLERKGTQSGRYETWLIPNLVENKNLGLNPYLP